MVFGKTAFDEAFNQTDSDENRSEGGKPLKKYKKG